MFAKCVVDRPELDGVRTYDFDPLAFTVVEAPPPTTVEVPHGAHPADHRGEPGAGAGRAAHAPGHAGTDGGDHRERRRRCRTPATGRSAIALAGLGALLVGGGALWWGARHGRRQPSADLAD